MVIEVDKDDLVAFVKSVNPAEHLFEHSLVSIYGKFVRGEIYDWIWDKKALQEAEPEVLWAVYTLCKKSWERV